MQINRDTLMELRRLRLDAQYHSANAAEYMARATHGTSTRRATDMSGTGDCPLTTSADAYGREHAAAVASTKAANAIWAQVLPLLDGVGLDERLVIEYLYNKGMEFPDIAKAIKRSVNSCYQMHRDTVAMIAWKSIQQLEVRD